MFSPLSISTRGWLSPSTSKALTLSTIGRLIVYPIIGGGLSSVEFDYEIPYRSGATLEEKDSLILIKEDIDDIINIIKIWTKCQG